MRTQKRNEYIVGDIVRSRAVQKNDAFYGLVVDRIDSVKSPGDHFYWVIDGAGRDWHRDAADLTLLARVVLS
jgi:hypothetical protein